MCTLNLEKCFEKENNLSMSHLPIFIYKQKSFVMYFENVVNENVKEINQNY